MGGCLGPKQRRQQVYIQMIQTIHEQVTHMNFQQSENLDIYLVIKQKLSKKGLIRKLIDNLVSHKNKIYDSLNHNYQTVLQTSKIQGKYAGLLIIDQIVEGIYQSLKSSKPNNDSQDFTNMTNMTNNLRSQILMQPLNKVLNNIKNHKNSSLMQSNSLVRQVDSRFDQIYFNLIIYLLENVPKMYLRILKSINSFCLNKKTKFNCTQSVWDTLNFIMTRILKDIHLKQSTYTYNLLLQNTKQNFKQYQKSSDLKAFIKIWLAERSKNIKLITPQKLHSLVQDQSIYDEVDSEAVIINTIKIISLCFNINISTWNSPYIYDALLEIYDQFEFQNSKIIQFQNVIFQIVMKNDLYVHFFRGLFVELLQYICFQTDQRASRGPSGFYSNPDQPQWINVGKKTVKFNAIKTLRRWVTKKHVDLNQTVSYNCSLLVNSYIDNLHPLDTLQNNQICKQFLKLIRQHLTAKSKQILVSSLIEHIKNGQTDPRIRTLIVSIMRQLLEDQEIFFHFGQDFDYILTIDEHYSKQNQMQLVQLMGFVVKALPQNFFNEKCDPNSSQIINFKHHICEFMYTCFQVIVFGSADQLFKYRFCCALLSFLRSVQSKGCYVMIYAFYLELIKQLTISTTTKHIPNKNYYILYLTYQVSHILVNQIRVPNDFKALNQMIASSIVPQNSLKSSRNVKEEINAMIQKIVIQDKYTEPNLIREQFRCRYVEEQINKTRKISKQNLQSTSKILRNYFAAPLNNSRNLSTRQENQDRQSSSNYLRQSANGPHSGSKNTNNPFGRRDSIFHQSQNGSYYKEEDKNLKDVLNILHT